MVLSRRSGSSSGTNTVGSRPQKIIREKEREREREDAGVATRLSRFAMLKLWKF